MRADPHCIERCVYATLQTLLSERCVEDPRLLAKVVLDALEEEGLGKEAPERVPCLRALIDSLRGFLEAITREVGECSERLDQALKRLELLKQGEGRGGGGD